jgi:hypothetical protein
VLGVALGEELGTLGEVLKDIEGAFAGAWVRAFKPEDCGLVAITSDLACDGCFVRIKAECGESDGELEVARVKELGV